jgi:hypothetical protein
MLALKEVRMALIISGITVDRKPIEAASFQLLGPRRVAYSLAIAPGAECRRAAAQLGSGVTAAVLDGRLIHLQGAIDVAETADGLRVISDFLD